MAPPCGNFRSACQEMPPAITCGPEGRQELERLVGSRAAKRNRLKPGHRREGFWFCVKFFSAVLPACLPFFLARPCRGC